MRISTILPIIALLLCTHIFPNSGTSEWGCSSCYFKFLTAGAMCAERRYFAPNTNVLYNMISSQKPKTVNSTVSTIGKISALTPASHLIARNAYDNATYGTYSLSSIANTLANNLQFNVRDKEHAPLDSGHKLSTSPISAQEIMQTSSPKADTYFTQCLKAHLMNETQPQQFSHEAQQAIFKECNEQEARKRLREWADIQYRYSHNTSSQFQEEMRLIRDDEKPDLKFIGLNARIEDESDT